MPLPLPPSPGTMNDTMAYKDYLDQWLDGLLRVAVFSETVDDLKRIKEEILDKLAQSYRNGLRDGRASREPRRGRPKSR